MLSWLLSGMDGDASGPHAHAHEAGHEGTPGSWNYHGPGNHGQLCHPDGSHSQDMDAHAGGGGADGASTGGKALHGLLFAPFLSPLAFSAMAAAGGGAGYLARLAGATPPVSLAWALPAGLVAGYGISGLIRWLHRGTRVLPPTDIRGTLATVLARTGPDRVGEILYTSRGSRTSLPARSRSAELLEPGVQVVVLDVQDGIALVARPGEFLDPESVPLEAGPRRTDVGELWQAPSSSQER